jgi:hypothetical protein
MPSWDADGSALTETGSSPRLREVSSPREGEAIPSSASPSPSFFNEKDPVAYFLAVVKVQAQRIEELQRELEDAQRAFDAALTNLEVMKGERGA